MPIITSYIWGTFPLDFFSSKFTCLSLIRLLCKVIYNVEKLYVDKLGAQKPRDFNLFNTSHEFFKVHRSNVR